MNNKILKAFAVSILMIAIVSMPAVAANSYYVATTGSDSNPGTLSAPFKTIQKGVESAYAGDTVYVRGGVYNEKISFPRSGTSTNWITLTRYANENAILDAAGKVVDSYDAAIHISSKSYIRVSYLRVRNSGWDGVRIDDYAGTQSSNIYIDGLVIYENQRAGIVAENSNNINIIYNILNLNQKAGLSGGQQNEIMSLLNVDGFNIKYNSLYSNYNFESVDVKMGSKNGNIAGNVIYPVESAGIYVDAYTGLSQNIRVYNNIVRRESQTRSGSRGIVVGAEEAGSRATNIDIFNNLVYDLPAQGINIPWYSKGQVDDVSIENNAVYKTDVDDHWGGGINTQANTNGGSTSNIRVRNNIASQNGVAQISGSYAACSNNLRYGVGGISCANDIVADPLFVNPDGGNLRLQSSSPAINAGTDIEAPAFDFDTNVRPYNTYFDIGAYEWRP